METRKLALALITGLNAMAQALEEAAGEDGGEGEEENEREERRSSRSKKKTTSRRSRSRDDDDADDDKDDDDAEEGDHPDEDEIVDAVKAAQKVLESADIKKLLKKHGKADRASEVEPELRQKVIDALDKAVEAAE